VKPLNQRAIRILFVLAALYEGLLGLLFLIAPGYAFEVAEVTPPNHMGYVQFPAALLIVFALLFWNIARDPVAGCGLIPYGIGLKLSYVALVFGYELTEGIPSMWIPFAWADLAFLALFAWAWASISRGGRR